jgi:cytoskeletal protein CcmA (bactofilin family)
MFSTNSKSPKEWKEETNLEKIDTLIGDNVSIDGNISSTGTVRLDCSVVGNVSGDGLIVGESGSITGDIECSEILIDKSSVIGNIKCKNITISGKVEGDVKCKGTLKLTNTASLTGDVEVGKLVIDNGAFFKGLCAMIDKSKDMNLNIDDMNSKAEILDVNNNEEKELPIK